MRNVTVIVGLRAYAAKSNILPEQTLGRGLRRMYFGSDQRETVSVMGTPAFMEFVESIQSEGVTFERVAMGARRAANDRTRWSSRWIPETPDKDIDALDIALPRLTRRFNREFKDLAELDPASFGNPKLPVKAFTPEETREIVFKTMLDSEIDHTIQLDGSGPGGLPLRRRILRPPAAEGPAPGRRLRPALPQGQGLHPRPPVCPSRSISMIRWSCATCRSRKSGKVLFDSFRAAINALTIRDSGTSRIEGHIRLRDTRPFRTDPRGFLQAKRRCSTASSAKPTRTAWSWTFAAFLERAPDVQAFAKNYMAVGFKLDYVKADGDLSTYTPDFIVTHHGRRGLDRRDQGPRGTRPAAEDGATAPVVRRRDGGQRG